MKPVNAVQIIREAFATYQQHAAVVLGVSLLINGCGLLASIVLINTLGILGVVAFYVLAMCAQQLQAGALSVLMASRWGDGQLASIQEIIRPSLRRLGSLTVAAIIYSVCVGFMMLLFIIPGVWLACRWAVALPAIVIGQQGPSAALKQSGQYTSQAMDSVLGVTLFTLLMAVLAPRIVSGMAGGGTAPLEVVVISTFAVTAVVGPLAALATAELYLRLAPPVSAGGPVVGRGGWVPVAPGAPGGGPFAAPVAMATAVPQGYGMPAAAPAPYGAPAANYAPPAPYGAPPAYAQPGPPAGLPPQPAPYGAPPAYAQPGPPADYAQPAPYSYGAPAPPPALPGITPPAAMPGVGPAQPYAQPPAAPMGGPGPSPVHPGRDQSVAPPGMG